MTARDEAIEAAAKAEYAYDGGEWESATEMLRDDYRGSVRVIAAVVVPVLLNDLADRIEDERMGDEIDDWNVALIKAAETVRAAAEGWRTD